MTATRGETKGGLLSRRTLIAGAVGVAAGSAAGLALGYRLRTELRDLKLRLLASPQALPPEAGRFRQDAAAIEARHASQTVETVAELKRRYEAPTFGRTSVWELVEKLARCIDPTDKRLFCASQAVHWQQVVAAMEANGVDDPDMLLLGVIHDLGKVLLLQGEAPENVVCGTELVAAGPEGAGLDQAVFQFGHGEYLYSRIVDQVPEHVAFVARFHNVAPQRVRHLMNEREREWTDRYLIPFQDFDAKFCSPYYAPRVDFSRYRDLVESYFPKPILV